MSTEGRFILALSLMFLVIWGTNKLFPPVFPDEPAADSTLLVEPPVDPAAEPAAGSLPLTPPTATDPAGLERPPAQIVRVESPLYRFDFNSRGASLESAEMLQYETLAGGEGPVQLLPEGIPALTKALVAGDDTLELAALDFTVEPARGLILTEGSGPQTLTFRHASEASPLAVTLRYTFRPDAYLIEVEADVQGVDRPLLTTGLGRGIAFNEADSAQEARVMAWVGNHLERGVRSTEMRKVDTGLHDGPWRWAGVKSKFFLMAVLPGAEMSLDGPYLGGVATAPGDDPSRASIEVSQAVGSDGSLAYRLYLGPQVYSSLQLLGADLEEVNPYGWKWLRPLIRPFVAITLWVLNFLHDTLSVGYGWVLVIFGVIMRILLWPLNQKAMRAQMRNMQVQPLVKEIQAKYKDNPEKQQKEMMRLYKEYGFNPLAGCLPMLLPWPVLIALFFVFQNTIELRGVSFLWLPDLSAKDPLYILPIVLGVSMFLLQYISFRSMPDTGQNPQMKMMMYVMPPFFAFIFMQFPSGLNLYYATSNLATLPQQLLIARERREVAGAPPVKLERRDRAKP